MTFELTLKGFDGSTDATDHLIKWVNAIDRPALEKWLHDTGLQSALACAPSELSRPLTHADGVDFTLGKTDPKVIDNWKDQSTTGGNDYVE